MPDWPDDFDFSTDETCQSVFKPFIERALEDLKAYDALRPLGTAYVFHEHASRVADDVKKTCLHMGLGETVAGNMFWALLPHDIGKTRLPIALWDQEQKPDEDLKALRRTHTSLGLERVNEELAGYDHPFKILMGDIMLHHHEQMDGNGTHRVRGEDLSSPVRLAAIVEAFDGWRTARPHFEDRDVSAQGVLTRMREEKGPAHFDMDFFEAFAAMKNATPHLTCILKPGVK